MDFLELIRHINGFLKLEMELVKGNQNLTIICNEMPQKHEFIGLDINFLLQNF